MAGSSSTAATASTAAQRCEVFINHRGVDVKKTFARSLYSRLLEKGLRGFLDEEEMQPGFDISSQLKLAIRNASVHVAIFSPRYAESDWCLNELLLMLESEAPIIPVFYRVKPSEVRWTRGKDGKYAEALETLGKKRTYEGKPRYESDLIDKWRNALSQVANKSGFELEVACNGEELQLDLLDKLVECLSKMLKKPHLHVADYPTGLDYKLKEFEDIVLLQQQQSRKPGILGIWGLGGVGKTTLAKQFFNKKKSDYHKSCFLFDVKDHAAKGSLNVLQTRLLKDLTGFDKRMDSLDEGKGILIEHLGSSSKQINSVAEGKEVSINHLESSNALIILDDVNDVDQVNALLPVETRDLLSGSLILITSRDKALLTSARVEIPSIYRLTGLNPQNSRKLFCNHAFSQDYPLQEYEYLTERFVESSNGLPLYLKVIGAHLYGKDISYWENQLGILPNQVIESLKISYNALDKEEQRMFLDIACFLRGQNRDTAINIWKGSGWNGSRGFQNLQDRCLVEVDSKNVINMHDHLRDLGREIGEESSPFRLWRWNADIIDNLLQQSVITVRGLKMDRSEFNKYSADLSGLIETRRLQILDIEDDVLERISKRLVLPQISWLCWRRCPYPSLPSWIQVQNLRHLEVSESNLNTLWESGSESQAPLEELEELIITNCLKLESIPELGYYTKLRELNVCGCSELKELANMGILTSLEKFQANGCMKLKSILGVGQCTKLQKLDVRGCSELEALPSMETVTSLEGLWANGCVKLKTIPGLEQCTKLQTLDVQGCSQLRRLNVEGCSQLRRLNVEGCSQLRRLNVQGCSQLQTLNFPGCSQLRTLIVQGCSQLPALNVQGSQLQTLNVQGCSQLQTLNVQGCSQLQMLNVQECSQLQTLNVQGCTQLEVLHLMEILTSLEELSTEGCVKLKIIWLEQCTKLETLTVAWCSQLQMLNVSGCSELEALLSMETLTSLEALRAEGCVKLKTIRGLEQCTKLERLHVQGCSQLQTLNVQGCCQLLMLNVQGCSQLQTLNVQGCSQLCMLNGLGCSQLQTLNVQGCSQLESLTSLEELSTEGCVKLKTIWLEQCTKLEKLTVAWCSQLQTLNVSGCSELEVLLSMETLTSLEALWAEGCVKLKTIRGLEQCTKLQKLNVQGCSQLEALPNMETLTSLEGLWAPGCVKLKTIRGLEQCTKLHALSVLGCLELEEVEGVEHFTWLEHLYVSGCPKLECPVWE